MEAATVPVVRSRVVVDGVPVDSVPKTMAEEAGGGAQREPAGLALVIAREQPQQRTE